MCTRPQNKHNKQGCEEYIKAVGFFPTDLGSSVLTADESARGACVALRRLSEITEAVILMCACLLRR